MKKIILIQPSAENYGHGLWGMFDLPFGLLAISILPQKEFEITIIDSRIQPNWKKKLKDALQDAPLCVGIRVTASHIAHALQISQLVKQHAPKTPVIWGGAIPKLAPTLALKENNVDICVTGDGEVTFYELCIALRDNKPLSNILGIVYKQNHTIFSNPPAPHANLDEFADMPFHLIDVEKYTNSQYLEKFEFSIETSRSCPNLCTFCINAIRPSNAQPWLPDHTIFRSMSAKTILKRMELLKKTFQVKRFRIIDENFLCNPEIETILEQMIERNFNIRWHTSTEPRQIKNKAFAKLMKESGCAHITIGIDSGSPRIRKMLNRETSFETLYRTLDILQEVGIQVYYFFMTGLPTETDEDLHKTATLMLDLTKRYPNNRISHCSIFHPWPHTPLYKKTLEAGLVAPQHIIEYDIDAFRGVRIYSNKKYLDYLSTKQFRKLQTISLSTHIISNKDALFSYPWFIKYPIAVMKIVETYRLKHNFFYFNLEPYLWTVLHWLGKLKLLQKILQKKAN